jgi:23S rRNA (pseudouridine1915-N3)-methyltransferase
VEGRRLSSPALAALLADTAGSGTSKLCFIVGGSYGLGENVKRACAQRLSLSDMTFPHALARVMLMEQVYRAFSISAGSKYHK